MRLYCLSSHPNKPCYVLTFKGITLMLDCGLSAHTALNFLPLPLVHSARLSNLPTWMPRENSDPDLEGELKECNGRVFVDSAPEFCPPLAKVVDFSQIDVILISNYMSMLALPFITEGTGFDGIVYCTEPTLQIGRLYLEELVQFIEQSPKASLACHWKEFLHLMPPPLCDSSNRPRNWQQLYSLAQVQKSLARIQVLGYDQKMDVYGSLRVTPVSSGYCLGSSNWVINSDHEKITYVSGSSTLTTHPRPMDQTSLKHSNVLILTALTQTPIANPDSMLGELCMTVASTIRNNGSVLIPCYVSGTVYDLFECLSTHLDNVNLTNVPMFFISPVADTSIAYSNILAEWLSQAKQSKVYLPEEPFPHAQLIKSGRLKHFKHIYDEGFSTDFRQPCVVFCGHPSLRFGDAVHFVEMWASNPQHTIIFTEPDFAYLEALAPFQPVAMKALHCPIDTSLNYNQANKLIRELKPQHLVLPECYTQPPINFPLRLDLVVSKEQIIGDRKQVVVPAILPVKRGEVHKLPVRCAKAQVQLDPELAHQMVRIDGKAGVSVCSVTGRLTVKDNQFILESLKPEDDVASTSSGVTRLRNPGEPMRNLQYEYGPLGIDQFVQRLNQEGISDAKIEPHKNGYIIHLQEHDTLIQIDDNLTHIYCAVSDQELRLRLRNILLQCLNKF
uniref:Beta-Casp domain-containing protein n=1 Tax=Graphocephala atropunctata TaxID=36148 RepID=A0A1B6MCP8_9HEMI